MRKRNRSSAWFAAACGLAFPANADEAPTVADLIALSTYQAELDGGVLKGPGAQVILQLAADAQFVALGEEHFNYYIPRITTALFAALRERYGFQYFITEQDPVMMEVFSHPPVRGDHARVNALAQSYPMGVTFNSDQELEMLARIGGLSTAADNAIWGCDQTMGVTHVLDALLPELQSDRARQAVEALRRVSVQREAIRDYSKAHYLADAPAETFETLKAAVDPASGSRAEWLLDTLIHANRIFGFYRNGQQGRVPGFYENNRYREEYMKDLCLEKYRAAERFAPHPKGLMKFGSWHVVMGLSPTRVHTVGDFFANVARFNGLGFLSVYFTSRPDDLHAQMKQYGFVWPFIRDLKEEQFAVIDLRPFRAYPVRAMIEKSEGEEWLQANQENFVRLVYGYDLIFYLGKNRPATFEVVPQVGVQH